MLLCCQDFGLIFDGCERNRSYFFAGKSGKGEAESDRPDRAPEEARRGAPARRRATFDEPMAAIEANEYEAQREARITKNYEKLRDLVNDSLQRTIETVYAAENEGKENANARR